MTFDSADYRSDRDLLEAAREGDQQAFGQIAAKYYQNCVRVATSILRDPSEAEDQVQQALRKAFQHIDQYLGEADFIMWLLRIVVNECRMWLRRNRRVHCVYLNQGPERRTCDLVSPITDPEHQTIAGDMIQVLRTEIRRVPLILREVLLLRDVDGIPMPEIAERLGITVPAAKSRLMRAREELRRRITDRFGPSRHMMPINTSATLRRRALYTSSLPN